MEAVAAPSRNKRFGGQRLRLLVVGALVLGLVGGAVLYKRSIGRAVHAYDRGPVKTESDTITSLPSELGRVVTFGSIVLRDSSSIELESLSTMLPKVTTRPSSEGRLVIVSLSVLTGPRS